MNYYIHYVPGRIRIETPFIHNNLRNAQSFASFLTGVKGIRSVKTRPAIGSVTVFFDEEIINCEQIIGILEKHGHFLLSKAETSDQIIKKATEKVLEKL